MWVESKSSREESQEVNFPSHTISDFPFQAMQLWLMKLFTELLSMKLVGVREDDTKDGVRSRQMIGCGVLWKLKSQNVLPF